MYDELKIGYFCFSDSAKIGYEKKSNPTTRIAIPRIKDLITVKNSDEKNFWFQNSNLGSKANKYKEYSVTLSASSWNVPSGCTYAQYSISNTAITENSDICITLPGSGNIPDAVTDWINASVTPGPQYNGKIMIHAYGTKPTHDIVIIMLIGSDTISS